MEIDEQPDQAELSASSDFEREELSESQSSSPEPHFVPAPSPPDDSSVPR
jgi:hypothetical protein